MLTNSLFKKLFNKKALIIAALLGCIVIYQACNPANNKTALFAATAVSPFTSAVPADIANPADPAQAAQFAWREFVALTWPAKVNPTPAPGNSAFFRGQPSATDSSGSTGAGGTVVWETFYHRDELYPTYTTGGNVLPNPDTIPNYIYTAKITPATPTTNMHLFNNLDEASEINIAAMFYTPLAEKADLLKKSITGTPTPIQAKALITAQQKATIIYEAKGNPVIFNYVKANSYNNAAPRRNARNQAVNLINNRDTTGITFKLPNGSIEVKATWRHYDATKDNLKEFHWAVGLYYTGNDTTGFVANNDTLLLISLHIIQKTPNVPTFTFATFEHVSNEKNGFRFINFNPLTDTGKGLPRPLPDAGIITAARQYPIPGAGSAFDLVSYNTAVQTQLRSQFGADDAWPNYQLIGVQAIVQNDPGGVVPAQQFFLSNFATETNNTLQFFQGGLGGPFTNVPNPDLAHVYVVNPATKKYIGMTAGGCLGCHGSQGQDFGGDFSVIAATGNAFIPEGVHPYPGGPVVPQNPKGFPLPHMMGAMTRKK